MILRKAWQLLLWEVSLDGEEVAQEANLTANKLKIVVCYHLEMMRMKTPEVECCLIVLCTFFSLYNCRNNPPFLVAVVSIIVQA